MFCEWNVEKNNQRLVMLCMKERKNKYTTTINIYFEYFNSDGLN